MSDRETARPTYDLAGYRRWHDEDPVHLVGTPGLVLCPGELQDAREPTARDAEILWLCPRCGRSVLQQGGGSAAIDEARRPADAAEANRRSLAAGLPERHLLAARASGDTPDTAPARQIAGGNILVVLQGTHERRSAVCAAAVVAAIQRGQTARYLLASDALQWRGDHAAEPARLTTVGLVVVDALGEESVGRYDHHVIPQLLDLVQRRWSAGRPTVVASSLGGEALAGALGSAGALWLRRPLVLGGQDPRQRPPPAPNRPDVDRRNPT